ncbi:hypothetical protein F5880DRAFT_1521352 [Lentinula raphanica]|nr:hypothetical protein F5880DRAFT_1521352 [Lentinula raphanica]
MCSWQWWYLVFGPRWLVLVVVLVWTLSHPQPPLTVVIIVVVIASTLTSCLPLLFSWSSSSAFSHFVMPVSSSSPPCLGGLVIPIF